MTWIHTCWCITLHYIILLYLYHECDRDEGNAISFRRSTRRRFSATPSKGATTTNGGVAGSPSATSNGLEWRTTCIRWGKPSMGILRWKFFLPSGGQVCAENRARNFAFSAEGGNFPRRSSYDISLQLATFVDRKLVLEHEREIYIRFCR